MRIAIHGATGRMGHAVADVCAAEGLPVVARFADPTEAGGEITALGPIDADVVIDFSARAAIGALAERCLSDRVPLVSGTTGLGEGEERALAALAKIVPVVHAPNMSAGVTVLFHLAELATKLLGPDFDPEVVEMHHRHKVDAPSGTAVRLAERVAAARGGAKILHGRSGQVGARTNEEIGVMTLRGGSVVGEHTLVLAGAGERLELIHRAQDRSIFARGAVRAARWIVGKPPGRYDMPDVLGIGR